MYLTNILTFMIENQYGKNYLSTLPTTEKKFRVAIDWFADLFFPRDITILSDGKIRRR